MKLHASALFVLALSACHAKSSEPAQPSPSASAESEHRDEPGHEALPTRVKLSPQVIADAKIEFAPVTKCDRAEPLKPAEARPLRQLPLQVRVPTGDLRLRCGLRGRVRHPNRRELVRGFDRFRVEVGAGEVVHGPFHNGYFLGRHHAVALQRR